MRFNRTAYGRAIHIGSAFAACPFTTKIPGWHEFIRSILFGDFVTVGDCLAYRAELRGQAPRYPLTSSSDHAPIYGAGQSHAPWTWSIIGKDTVASQYRRQKRLDGRMPALAHATALEA